MKVGISIITLKIKKKSIRFHLNKNFMHKIQILNQTWKHFHADSIWYHRTFSIWTLRRHDDQNNLRGNFRSWYWPKTVQKSLTILDYSGCSFLRRFLNKSSDHRKKLMSEEEWYLSLLTQDLHPGLRNELIWTLPMLEHL